MRQALNHWVVFKLPGIFQDLAWDTRTGYTGESWQERAGKVPKVLAATSWAKRWFFMHFKFQGVQEAFWKQWPVGKKQLLGDGAQYAYEILTAIDWQRWKSWFFHFIIIFHYHFIIICLSFPGKLSCVLIILLSCFFIVFLEKLSFFLSFFLIIFFFSYQFFIIFYHFLSFPGKLSCFYHFIIIFHHFLIVSWKNCLFFFHVIFPFFDNFPEKMTTKMTNKW